MEHYEPPALDGYTAYTDEQDGTDHLVICDTTTPTAWVRSDTTYDLDDLR